MVGLACVALFNTSAFGSVIAASTLLSDFNTVIFSNATTSADIEGAAIIGGNFSGATVYNNPKSVALPTSFNALNVYGNTSGNPINMNNGGNAYVGGTHGETINFNGGGHYNSVPSTSMSTIQNELTSLSGSLSTLLANSYFPASGNNEVITATPNSAGLAVFDVTSSQLSSIPSYSFDLNGASTVIINVSGPSLDFTANYEGNDSADSDILWNFYQATSLDFNTLIGGSILAPDASVTNNNQIDGTLVAQSWTGQGELHEYGFDGTLPSQTPSQTPEPASIVLFALGLISFGLLARRNLRQQ
jgi:choice-of-anchor A domain-containing protein